MRRTSLAGTKAGKWTDEVSHQRTGGSLNSILCILPLGGSKAPTGCERKRADGLECNFGLCWQSYGAAGRKRSIMIFLYDDFSRFHQSSANDVGQFSKRRAMP